MQTAISIETASQLVCPFIQSMRAPYANERGGSIPRNINCITTKCMAWIDDTSYVVPQNKRADLQYYMENRDPFDNRSETERHMAFLRQHGEKQESGYCQRLKHE